MAAGESIYNVAKGRKERIGRLVKMHANKREEIKEVLAGDICAAVGLKSVSTGDTICDEKHPVILESIDFPAPVIQLAIEPKTKVDQEKLGMAIAKLVQEDPTLKVSTDPDTGQTILAGMGELHLEIIVDRMQREFGVGANVGKPQVAYRETIRQDRRVRLHAQEADRRQRPVRALPSCGSSLCPAENSFSRTTSRAATFPRNSFRRSRRAWWRRWSTEFSPAIPMSDVKVTVFDGAYHDVDSSEMAFKICAFDLRQGSRRKAKPVLLEPVMASKWWCRTSTWAR